ncbi:MAG: diguanylate cyclase [candidate division Zixibacteria bacterium RBG_16_53_22]|nr:MAG: diguanylate cyclase [candidate division Zixibacteria bacterium RBG_16_53_22]
MNDLRREIPGIHHITAIAGDPRENVEFYTGVLGLRMVKMTVNFDDPSAYHLYFGDELGRPGTALTFFSWPGARRGRRGAGQAVACSFSVPDDSLGYWVERLGSRGIRIEGRGLRFEEEYISFSDHDGLALELVAHNGAKEKPGWDKGSVPAEMAIRGFHSVTLSARNHEPTANFLIGTMGFRASGDSGNLFRFQTGAGDTASNIYIRREPDNLPGLVAVGTIHHVAWRTPNDEEQAAWRGALAQKGANVTQIVDRLYFRSIYFREPGGVLFEIATDTPGFTVDEAPELLGTSLKLPPWMEQNRPVIEHGLPPIELKKAYR